MKTISLALAFTTLLTATLLAEIPNIDDFRAVPQFPQPSEFAFGVSGTTTTDGRFILWDGDTVYLQASPGSDELTPIATGYPGDPGFIALAPDGHTIALGSGFSQELYLLDINNPVDAVPGSAIPVPTHFGGAFLTQSLILLDRGNDDFTGSELVVVDLDTMPAPGTLGDRVQSAQTVLEFPISNFVVNDLTIIKPAGSYSSKIHVDNTRTNLYAMDAFTGELRFFSVAAIIEAFTNSTTLDWTTDGTAIGFPGDFFTGGVAGINPDAQLIIGGSPGFGIPGGVQYIDPEVPAMVLATLDPAGTQPHYDVIYSRATDEMIAIDTTFGQPLQAYARTSAIAPVPPESPCELVDEVVLQWEVFSQAYGLTPDTADINLDEIPDHAMLLLALDASCNTVDPIGDATRTAYDTNLDAFDAEISAAAISDYRELIAILMLMSDDMQTDLRIFLNANNISLPNTYDVVTCLEGGECFPVFSENPGFPDLSTRSAIEPYSAEGDFDSDTFTNLTEYQNVIANGGEASDFVIAATAPTLDGTSTIRTNASSGGCFIATAAYGTPMATEVEALRTLRDTYLLDNPLGATFVDTYYRLSPPIANVVSKSPTLGALIRVALAPIILLAKLVNLSPALLLIPSFFVLLAGLIRRNRARRVNA